MKRYYALSAIGKDRPGIVVMGEKLAIEISLKKGSE